MRDHVPMTESTALHPEHADVDSSSPPAEPIDDGVTRPPSFRRPSLPSILVGLAVAVWTWYFTARSLDIHHGLGTASYDSALYDQGMWLLCGSRRPSSR